MRILRSFVISVVVLAAGTAAAQAPEMQPLDQQVAIRHRYELRRARFEIGPTIGFSLNRAFVNAFVVGARMQFHLNEYLSLGTEWGFGINFNSALTGELESTYLETQKSDKPIIGDEATRLCKAGITPRDCFKNTIEPRLSRLKAVGDVRVNFTPFYGKLSLLSALFLKYDFYAFLGAAFGLTGNKIDDPDVDATNEGFNVGLAWGFGMHIYANNWVSIGIEFKDLMFKDNESGQDVTRGLEDNEQAVCNPANPATCRLVNADDRFFLNHFFFGLNVTFFLPTKPSVAF